jgi:hypothetical protein
MKKFTAFLKTYYNLIPDDVIAIDIEGCWQMKCLCGGKDKCNLNIHDIIPHGVKHTILYLDTGNRERTYTWKKFRKRKSN